MDEIFNWMNDWSNKKIINNKSFKEYVTYDGVSLWWFVDGWIREHDASSAKVVSVKQIINYLNDINTKIESKTDKEINRELSEKLLKDINKKKIKCRLVYFLFNLKQSFRYYYLKVFNRNPLIKKIAKDKKKVLIISDIGNFRKKIDPVSKKESKVEEYFEPIIKELKKRDYVLKAIDIDFKPRIRLDVLREKKAPLWGFYEQYVTKDINVIVDKERENFERLWIKLKNNKNFICSFDYYAKNKKINLYPYLKDSFEIIFKYRFPEVIKRIEVVKNIIDVEKPNVVSLIDEASSFGRSVVAVAKLKGVPVVAIQHGVNGPYSFEYLHLKEDISPEGSVKSPYCPIPDRTAVYGPYDKILLTEISAYPKDSVTVTGQPRYDILTRANEIFSREKTFEKLNLDKNKKLIVWTTNSHVYTEEENEKLFYGVYTTVKELSDRVQLVIKLHPNEFDTTIHKRIANEVGVNVIIIKDIDIFEILYACDLLLTEFSTTGIEASILGKPLITMHFAGHPDLGGYAKSGVALGVYKEEDLIVNIKKALYDKETREKLEKAREKFVYERAYKLDGKATERICDLIEEMIKESKK